MSQSIWTDPAYTSILSIAAMVLVILAYILIDAFLDWRRKRRWLKRHQEKMRQILPYRVTDLRTGRPWWRGSGRRP